MSRNHVPLSAGAWLLLIRRPSLTGLDDASRMLIGFRKEEG